MLQFLIGPPMHVDLAGVRHADSAGLALLLQWQAEQSTAIRVINAPHNLVRLAEMCEADSLLDLTALREDT